MTKKKNFTGSFFENFFNFVRPLWQYQYIGMMDSQGDFNFCTEYKDLSAVLIIKRTRQDEDSILSAIAFWQNKNNIDLPTAQKMGDIRYCLQGEKDKGSFFTPRAILIL